MRMTGVATPTVPLSESQLFQFEIGSQWVYLPTGPP